METAYTHLSALVMLWWRVYARGCMRGEWAMLARTHYTLLLQRRYLINFPLHTHLIQRSDLQLPVWQYSDVHWQASLLPLIAVKPKRRDFV